MATAMNGSKRTTKRCTRRRDQQAVSPKSPKGKNLQTKILVSFSTEKYIFHSIRINLEPICGYSFEEEKWYIHNNYLNNINNEQELELMIIQQINKYL